MAEKSERARRALQGPRGMQTDPLKERAKLANEAFASTTGLFASKLAPTAE